MRVGSLVACKSNKSGWFRGEVKGFSKEKKGKDLIDVYMIDFGDSNYVELDRLRKLNEKFTELPMNAIECCLADVDPLKTGGNWSDQACDCFEEITFSGKWKTLRLKLVEIKEEKYNNQLFKIASVLLFDKV